MRIKLTSVLVDDQEKALQFYTNVLGFVKKDDFPMGQHRWLPVVSPDEPDTVQLLLEPNAHPAAKVFQKAIFGDGIPPTSFVVDDVPSEYERMSKLGVVLRSKPAKAGPATIAVLDDTCGNYIQIVHK